MWPIFKEKSNYPDFLHIRMTGHPNYSGEVEPSRTLHWVLDWDKGQNWQHKQYCMLLFGPVLIENILDVKRNTNGNHSARNGNKTSRRPCNKWS
jgi:hypothetical protein